MCSACYVHAHRLHLQTNPGITDARALEAALATGALGSLQALYARCGWGVTHRNEPPIHISTTVFIITLRSSSSTPL